jgi:hypothetical protein
MQYQKTMTYGKFKKSGKMQDLNHDAAHVIQDQWLTADNFKKGKSETRAWLKKRIAKTFWWRVNTREYNNNEAGIEFTDANIEN